MKSNDARSGFRKMEKVCNISFAIPVSSHINYFDFDYSLKMKKSLSLYTSQLFKLLINCHTYKKKAILANDILTYSSTSIQELGFFFLKHP